MDIIETIQYYNNNAKSFTMDTLKVNFVENRNRFISSIKSGAHILDFGCGSGRDTIHFLNSGYQVTAIDGSTELCKIATANTGIQVKHMLFQDLSDIDTYDGIWACSSILHLPRTDLVQVLSQMAIALKQDGIIYTSFKYGDFEGMRNGRYFIDMTESRFESVLEDCKKILMEDLDNKVYNKACSENDSEDCEEREAIYNTVAKLHIQETWITSDVRPGRENEKWLNIILTKRSKHD